MAGLDIEPGLIKITNPDGLTLFNTDDGLFHVIGDEIDTTINVSSFAFATGTNTNATDSTLLGTCHEDCTHAIGAIKFTLNSYVAGMPFDRWHTMMGGSVLWLMDGQNNANSFKTNIQQMVWYSLRVDSGNVYLDRRRCCGAGLSVTYTVLSHSIRCKLKTGLFT